MSNLPTLTVADLAAQMGISPEQLVSRVQKPERAGKLTLKVSEKGAVSVYGLGRWPTTLYSSQWEALLAQADAIREFIAANDARLSHKDA